MSKHCKINVKTLLAIVAVVNLLLLSCCGAAFGQSSRTVLPKKSVTLTDSLARNIVPRDTMRVLKDTLSSVDSLSRSDTLIKKDTSLAKLRVDTLRISKDSIDAPINYSADDSAVLIIDTREFLLYGKAKTDYKDIKLEAATIRYDQESQLVKAYGALDSSGNPESKPHLTEGSTKSISDTIVYNLKTGKGRTLNSFFQEGEIFVNAQVLKKVGADEAFAFRARFTTCNLDMPHFAFRSNKMKIINNKLGVSGPVYPEFEGVPIKPIFIPFGIFPLNPGRHSGILPPAFTASEDFGLGLEGLGYYKVFNDNLDVTTRANLYSYGGWTLNASSRYLVRYKYTGSLSITLQNTKSLNRFGGTKDEFNKSRSFMINWTHSRDSRARPGTNFSASVNFGSTRFNRNVLNNPFQNYQNQLSSSISYSKDWRGKYNLSVNANHNQNNNLHLVSLILPTVNFNVVTLYPFQPKDQVGTGKWYEKIGIGYSGNFQNQLSFYDTAFNFSRLLDTLQYGAQHSIPISLSLPSLGPVTLSPSISFEERWYGQKVIRSWNGPKQKVDTLISKGFYAARQFNFGMSANTRIFGTYKFKPNSRIIGIRHEIRPSISMNYKPDMAARYHYAIQVDTSRRTMRFSQFEGGVIGTFSEGAFGGIGFGIDNLLEMKVKDKADTSGVAEKKVKLIDGFGFNSSYNLLADSFALGDFTFYARSTLFEKVNITASASLDPYQADNMGYRLKQLSFDPLKFKFGRITSGNLAISTSFQSKSKDGKSGDQNIPVDPFMTPDEQQRQLQFARSNPAEFTDFNIPWTLTLAYSFNFTKAIKPDYSGYQTLTSSSLSFNGDFSLTDKWKLGGTGYYDVKQGLQQLSMFITREMHCWQLSINVTPIGFTRSFNITINPKSGILRDLRINRSRFFSGN